MTALLSHSANVNAQNMWGWTPLIKATWHGRLAAAQMLVNAGADVALTDNDGDTALHFTARNDTKEVALLLLQNGSDAKKQNNEGKTSADDARNEGYHQLADLIDNFTSAPNNFTPAPDTTTPARASTTTTLPAHQTTHAPQEVRSSHHLWCVCGAVITLSIITYLVLRHRIAVLRH
ncbi:unnamed protein product, partial [Meganyctiphanes norvegica]